MELESRESLTGKASLDEETRASAFHGCPGDLEARNGMDDIVGFGGEKADSAGRRGQVPAAPVAGLEDGRKIKREKNFGE